MIRGNRILWSIIGLILAALGVCGILINLGHMPNTNRHLTIWTDAMTARLQDWGGWVAAVGIVAGLIIAAAGSALIRAESRRRGGHNVSDIVFAGPPQPGPGVAGPETGTPRPGPAAPPAGPDAPPPDVSLSGLDVSAAGQTRVSGSTLRNALQRDLQTYPRIKHATVRMTGRPGKPRLHLRIDVPPGTELPLVRSHVDAAIQRFRTTSNLDPTVRETIVTVA